MSLELTKDEEKTVLEMACVCFSEGLLPDDSKNLLRKIFGECDSDIAEQYRWLREGLLL